MPNSKKLSERLVGHPQLEKRVSGLLDVIEAESSSLDRADEAEEAVIKHLKVMGNELLTDWGLHKEDQKFKAARELHPKAKSQKKHLLAEHLRKNRVAGTLS